MRCYIMALCVQFQAPALQVVIPKTYESLTSRRVLTTQWIEGEAQQLPWQVLIPVAAIWCSLPDVGC